MSLYQKIGSNVLALILPDDNETEMTEKAADEEDDNSSSSQDGDDDEGTITEIRFVPSDKAACE